MQTDLEATIQQTHNDLIRGLLRSLESHTPGEAGHAERVAVYTVAMGEKLGLKDEELKNLRIAAQLHDVGKVRVSASLLSKPGSLSDAEWDELRLHASLAEAVLESFGELAEATPLIRHHHERWDGTGYPIGLKGEAIPLGARIIAVSEAFDSMTHSTSFRPASSNEEAIAEIEAKSGSQFDPQVVTAFKQVQPLIQPLTLGS